MKKYSFFILLITIFSVGCQKYEVQFEGAYDDKDNNEAIPSIALEIAYAEGGEVYMMDASLMNQKKLSNMPADAEQVAINFSHDLIAVKAAGQDIVVFDTDGIELATIENSSEVEWFDWHANNQTLFMLTKGNISFYGPALSIDHTDLLENTPDASTDHEVFGLSILEDHTVIYNLRYMNQGDQLSALYFDFAGGDDSDYQHNLFKDEKATWIRSSRASEVTFIGTLDLDLGVERVIRYTDNGDGTFRDFRWNDSYPLATPSPSGSQLLFWKNGQFEIEDESAFHTTTNDVTSIDW